MHFTVIDVISILRHIFYSRPRGYKTVFILTQLSMKEALAIRRIFSLVDMITNTKFSNCLKVFKIGAVWQYKIFSKNTFQSN